MNMRLKVAMRLCYDCAEYDYETLKCKKYGTYVYTPKKAEHCKWFAKNVEVEEAEKNMSDKYKPILKIRIESDEYDDLCKALVDMAIEAERRDCDVILRILRLLLYGEWEEDV